MKTTLTYRRIALVAATLAALGTARHPLAEDIDLYVGGQAVTGGEVNVLIVLDNTSNFSATNQGFTDEYDADGDGNTTENGTQGSIEIGTLNEVAQTLGDTVNMGLMQYADDGGGYPVFAVRAMNNTTKTVFSNLSSTMKANVGTPQYKGPSNADYDDLLNSVLRYFNSFARYKDLNSQGDLRDYTGNTVPVDRTALGSFGYSGTPSNANYTGNYVGPSSADNNCTKNYVIFIGNGYPSQSANTKVTKFSDAVALFSPAPTPSSAAIAAADSLGQYAPYWTRFMKTYGVQNGATWNNITSYAIDVCKNGCDSGSGPNQATLLKSMAANGGGKYFKSTSKSEIKAALTQIFAEIQAVNSVFASATLPISVNTQGTYENQVYVGVFRPDSDARPRWYGNLKEYKFGRYCDADGNDQVLIDSTRALTSGIITATHTGTASGTVTGTFSGNVTAADGTVTAVSGNVSGTVVGSTTVYLAAAKSGSSAGTSGSPGTGLGSGTVTGSITGSGSGTGSSTFTGTLVDTPSLTGTYTITDERIADDVPAATCPSGTTLKLYLADKHGYRAIDESGNTGFIDLQARSYWSGASTFWATTPSTTAGSSDLPDGPEVERGGAAYRLRTKWAGTATSPNQDGRKAYTCLGTCLAAATGAAARTLSSNVISTTNTEVTGKTELQPPSGSATVSLARSGNTVTATATVAHGFSTGNTVTIAGATPTDYNGSKTITVTDATHFTYTLTEEPDASVTDAATATKAGINVNISTMTFTPTTAGSTATVTVTTATNHGLNINDTTTIANAANSALNGTFTVLTSDGTTGFTYQATLPANPGTETTHGTSVVGTQSETHATITYTTSQCKSGAAAGCFIVESTSGLGNNYAAGASVTISGSVPTVYNGTWTISAVGSSCTGVANGNQTKYCVTKAAASYTSPDAGAGKTASSLGVSEAVTIQRTLGNTYATVTATDGAHTFANSDTIAISGASKSQYNGSWTISNTASPTFRISPVTVTPSASPTGTITATTGSGTAGPDITNLILWTRGKDLWEDEDGNASLTNVRASIHGDVLHARPVVVNYGGATGIVGFYGSNDGFLRAVSGGLADTDGAELWSFVPEEFLDYNKLSRRYKNDQLVLYPNTGCSTTSPATRDYFWDGPVTAYQTTDLATTYIYAGMRRGGRSIYALDVSSPTAPKLLWRISNTKINNTASADYSELGQTWSEPKVVKLKGTNAGVTETLVALAFGAGYDNTVEDKPVGSQRSVTMGRGVYIANATTGARVALLAAPTGVTPYSFAAEVMPLDIDNDGYIDRIYAADTGGNVYRFDANQTVAITSSSYWTTYIIAKAGDVGNDGGTDARKFLFAPEVLPFKQGGQTKVNILVGSGDREKPLPNFKSTGAPSTLSCTSTNLYSGTYADTYYPSGTSTTAYQTYKVQDYFFSMIDSVQYGTDPTTANASPIVVADLKQINSSTVGTTTLNTGFDVSNPGVYKGWSIVLNNSPNNTTTNNEEKVVNQARVVGGVAYFATSTPALPDVSANICSNLGEARGYAVDPFTGLPAVNRTDLDGANTFSESDYSTKFSGGGLPPTVTAGVVTIGGTPYRFIIGSGGSSVTSASSIAGSRNIITLRGTRSRLYWSYGADN
jgi:type IV pilus assembly protein PilY1